MTRPTDMLWGFSAVGVYSSIYAPIAPDPVPLLPIPPTAGIFNFAAPATAPLVAGAPVWIELQKRAGQLPTNPASQHGREFGQRLSTYCTEIARSPLSSRGGAGQFAVMSTASCFPCTLRFSFLHLLERFPVYDCLASTEFGTI